MGFHDTDGPDMIITLEDLPTMRWALEWERLYNDETSWLLYHNGRLVGEAYQREDETIKWHCKTSDTRNTDAKTLDQAKAECEAEYWREMVRRFQDELKVSIKAAKL